MCTTHLYDSFAEHAEGEAFDLAKDVSCQTVAEAWHQLCRRLSGNPRGKI